MAIHHPGSRAGTGVAVKAIRNTVVHGGGKSMFASLNVVPMIDLFTMLVIFLIQQFSASGELLTVNANVSMPTAASPAQLERAPIITLTRVTDKTGGMLMFENEPVVPLSEVTEVKYPDWNIKQLGLKLDCNKEMDKSAPKACVDKSAWGKQQAVPCGGDPKSERCKKVHDSRKIIIQADRTVPFKVIKMVMATCGRHQFREPNFAVTQMMRQEAK
jgi:biopolymer transport protein ExbD